MIDLHGIECDAIRRLREDGGRAPKDVRRGSSIAGRKVVSWIDLLLDSGLFSSSLIQRF